MAITLSTTARNAACNGVVDLLDGGSISLQTSGSAVVATLTLPSPAFGAAATGVAAMNTVAANTASGTGTVTKAVFKNSGGTDIFTATVGTSGADINLSSVTFNTGDSVEITSYSHTQPA
jgi:hypothetical protein